MVCSLSSLSLIRGVTGALSGAATAHAAWKGPGREGFFYGLV